MYLDGHVAGFRQDEIRNFNLFKATQETPQRHHGDWPG
jgi:hypothetical protein